MHWHGSSSTMSSTKLEQQFDLFQRKEVQARYCGGI
jgi:hypothetical protein